MYFTSIDSVFFRHICLPTLLFVLSPSQRNLLLRHCVNPQTFPKLQRKYFTSDGEKRRRERLFASWWLCHYVCKRIQTKCVWCEVNVWRICRRQLIVINVLIFVISLASVATFKVPWFVRRICEYSHYGIHFKMGKERHQPSFSSMFSVMLLFPLYF